MVILGRHRRFGSCEEQEGWTEMFVCHLQRWRQPWQAGERHGNKELVSKHLLADTPSYRLRIRVEVRIVAVGVCSAAFAGTEAHLEGPQIAESFKVCGVSECLE